MRRAGRGRGMWRGASLLGLMALAVTATGPQRDGPVASLEEGGSDGFRSVLIAPWREPILADCRMLLHEGRLVLELGHVGLVTADGGDDGVAAGGLLDDDDDGFVAISYSPGTRIDEVAALGGCAWYGGRTEPGIDPLWTVALLGPQIGLGLGVPIDLAYAPFILPAALPGQGQPQQDVAIVEPGIGQSPWGGYVPAVDDAGEVREPLPFAALPAFWPVQPPAPGTSLNNPPPSQPPSGDDPTPRFATPNANPVQTEEFVAVVDGEGGGEPGLPPITNALQGNPVDIAEPVGLGVLGVALAALAVLRRRRFARHNGAAS